MFSLVLFTGRTLKNTEVVSSETDIKLHDRPGKVKARWNGRWYVARVIRRHDDREWLNSLTVLEDGEVLEKDSSDSSSSITAEHSSRANQTISSPLQPGLNIEQSGKGSGNDGETHSRSVTRCPTASTSQTKSSKYKKNDREVKAPQNTSSKDLDENSSLMEDAAHVADASCSFTDDDEDSEDISIDKNNRSVKINECEDKHVSSCANSSSIMDLRRATTDATRAEVRLKPEEAPVSTVPLDLNSTDSVAHVGGRKTNESPSGHMSGVTTTLPNPFVNPSFRLFGTGKPRTPLPSPKEYTHSVNDPKQHVHSQGYDENSRPYVRPWDNETLIIDLSCATADGKSAGAREISPQNDGSIIPMNLCLRENNDSIKITYASDSTSDPVALTSAQTFSSMSLFDNTPKLQFQVENNFPYSITRQLPTSSSSRRADNVIPLVVDRRDRVDVLPVTQADDGETSDPPSEDDAGTSRKGSVHSEAAVHEPKPSSNEKTIELMPGSGVRINKYKLNGLIDDYGGDSSALTRELLLALVGRPQLLTMTATGRGNGRKPIPPTILNAVEAYVVHHTKREVSHRLFMRRVGQMLDGFRSRQELTGS